MFLYGHLVRRSSNDIIYFANKEIKTQTAECKVIGEITVDVMLVAMNKVDMFPEEEKIERIEKMKKKLKNVLSTTKFVDAPIIPTAAAIGGEKVAAVNSKTSNKAQISSFGVDELVNLIKTTVKIPSRTFGAPFYFSFDHCFAIKGHGTVLTGTVLNGTVDINGRDHRISISTM